LHIRAIGYINLRILFWMALGNVETKDAVRSSTKFLVSVDLKFGMPYMNKINKKMLKRLPVHNSFNYFKLKIFVKLKEFENLKNRKFKQF
jgi:hypothetical protein